MTAHDPAHDSAPAEAAVDLDLLSDAMGGDDALVREVTDLYVEDGTRLLPRLEAAVRAGDLEVVRTLAHSLKGSSASIGAAGAATVFAEIERAAREGDAAPLPEALDRARAVFDRVVAFLV